MLIKASRNISAVETCGAEYCPELDVVVVDRDEYDAMLMAIVLNLCGRESGGAIRHAKPVQVRHTF
jgi:hypothetical protein